MPPIEPAVYTLEEAVIPANTWGLRQADSTVNEEDACAREAAASSVAE